MKKKTYFPIALFLLLSFKPHLSSATESPILVKFGYGGLQTSSNRMNNRSFSIQSTFEFATLGKISEKGYLSISATYLKKIYSRVFDNQILKERNTAIQIGLGYVHFLNESVRIGMDLGTHYRFTDPELIYISPGLDLSNDTSARDNTEYGMNVLAGFNFWKSSSTVSTNSNESKWSLDFDVKYFTSFTAKNNETANHVTYIVSYVVPWISIN